LLLAEHPLAAELLMRRPEEMPGEIPVKGRDEAAVAAFAKAQRGAYHTLDLGGGVKVEGQYDMDQYLPNYGLPDDLRGKTALDVGTASGYFAFELERRGATVTAIDIWEPSVFQSTKRFLGSQVKYLQMNLFDLDESFGQFDLVNCGSVLLHVRDIFGAVQCLRAVCTEVAVIATSVNIDERLRDVPALEFVGQKAADGDYWAYWCPNMSGLGKMLLRAGFARVEEVSTFTLASRPEYGHKTIHGVIKAYT
jgi:tRNA (mo5U34)-methyltransferase